MNYLDKHLAPVFMTALLSVAVLTSCTKHNQVLDLTTITPVPVLDIDTLYAVRGTATLQPIGGAAWDGSLEGVWNNAPMLKMHAVVPNLGNNTFTGFINNSTDITMRAVYDANNIYFLAEFDTPQNNVKSAQWYFNPKQTDMTKKWAQEATSSSLTNLNPDGSYRPAFAQDQFTIMFNISSQSFNSLNCYGSCHVNSSYGGTTTPDGGVMYTNGPTERLDVWRARMLQVANENQANDCFIDDGSSVGLGSSGTLDKNQVHSDWQFNNGNSASVPPSLQSAGIADGGFTNKQTLVITGTAKKANVPIWVIPAGSYTNSAILLSDTLSGKAVRVVGVDSMGVLTLSNASIIDPGTAVSGTNYQQVGTGDGVKCIPGSVIGIYTGSRGDVTANAFYTGSGWRILLQRKLSTGDNINDVNFISLNDQAFGIGAMFNGADNQHAIVAGLKLRFKK
jgi:hypothetical protein